MIKYVEREEVHSYVGEFIKRTFIDKKNVLFRFNELNEFLKGKPNKPKSINYDGIVDNICSMKEIVYHGFHIYGNGLWGNELFKENSKSRYIIKVSESPIERFNSSLLEFIIHQDVKEIIFNSMETPNVLPNKLIDKIYELFLYNEEEVEEDLVFDMYNKITDIDSGLQEILESIPMISTYGR